MRELGLKSLICVKKDGYYRDEQGRIAPKLLNREFKAAQPKQNLVTDITEFKVIDKKLYLSTILDLYNGEIISYTLADRPMLKKILGMIKKTTFNKKTVQTP